MIDSFSPPGVLTAKGACLAITETGQLYMQEGRRVVTADCSPEQWGLLSTQIERARSFEQRGPITIELSNQDKITFSRGNFGSVWLTLRTMTRDLRVCLAAQEVSDLALAAHLRSNNQTTRRA